MQPEPVAFRRRRKLQARTEVEQNIGDLGDDQLAGLEERRREGRAFLPLHHVEHPVHAALLPGDVVVVGARILERGKLRLDPERHTCHWDNRAVTLTVTEFLILQALATRPGVVKTRDALMDAAYDDQVYVDDRTIDSHIKRLRKKFKAVDDDFDMIETLYGVGYRFKEM